MDSFKSIFYKIVRRVSVADISLLMGCSVDRLVSQATDRNECYRVREFPLGKLSLLSNCNPEFDSLAFAFSEPSNFRCFIIEDGEDIVGYAWTGIQEIPAEHNRNEHVWTGLPMFLSDDSAYLFAAYIHPDYRGQRLYQTLIHSIGKAMESAGITRLFLTTDFNNFPAIKAVERMGFVRYGETRFFSFLRVRWASYCVTSEFSPNRLGRYIGDTKGRAVKFDAPFHSTSDGNY